MASPVRLGLVGAGRWGRAYIRTIAQMDDVRLARVASGNPETRSLVPPGCSVSGDWREALAARDVDGIIVSTPASTHAEIALEAIARGRPVLVEKPFALNVASAESVRAAASARGIFVMVDHVLLFHPANQALKRAVRADGPVRGITGRAGARGPYRMDAGALWDWGPHDVSMCIDLLGTEPEALDAECLESQPAEVGRAERVRIELRFAGNVRADIELSTLADRHRRFEVRLDSRTLHYDGALPEAPADQPLTRAVREFAASIAGGDTSTGSMDLGVAVVRTLERCAAAIAGKQR